MSMTTFFLILYEKFLAEKAAREAFRARIAKTEQEEEIDRKYGF